MWNNERARMSSGIFESNIYLLSPVTETPVVSLTKKSTIHTTSTTTTARLFMLANNELSSHRAGTVSNSAMSENHRKLPGPYCPQYTGTSKQTNKVKETLSHSGI